MNNDKLKVGLTDHEVSESLRKYGNNTLASQEKESLLRMFLESFKDIWIMVLCGALGLKIVLAILAANMPGIESGGGDIIEIVSIVVAILLATGFSTLSEYQNATRSEALQEEYSKTYAKLMRNGTLVSVLTSDIVKGDTILLQAGDKVPVDGLLFEGHIKVSQAALNGESRDESKHAADSYTDAESCEYDSPYKVFMGSVVTAGEAYMVATVIGDATELGKINKALTTDEEDERQDTSSLKLEKVAAGIGKLGVSAAVIAGILQVVFSYMKLDAPADFSWWMLNVAEAVMLMASIVIMAVPEGLPMMNSLVQSMNTESMYKKHILVKHKAAFSDSAYLNLLFSDKTGTITQGQLSLVDIILGNGVIVDNFYSTELLDAMTLNNLAKVSNDGTAIGSNNMDRALLTYALEHNAKPDYSKVKEVNGFDSEKKCATATLKDGTVYWKGATENIIDDITHFVDSSDEDVPFSDSDKETLSDIMLKQAKRTMKLLSVVRIYGDKKVLLGVLCLRDNVRQDAVETVHTLNKAGVQVVMVTGDMEETAKAIAAEAGIYNEEEGDVALTHTEMEALSDDELKEKLPSLKVVSRAKPLDKRRLVKIAQELDNVVGMTGDGVNDAPALKQADVGFAMGDGTAVAQEAGDVVILNNSLTSIKDCILNSRTMAKSVGKFLIFQLTVNVSTLLMNIVAPILGFMEPFSIVQILWINLIMDTLAALAFGGEPVLDRYMNEKPAKRTDNILTPYIKTSIGISALFITAGSIAILMAYKGVVDPLYGSTMMFAFFIYAIIANSFNTRSETPNLLEHINENPRFIYVMCGIFIMQTLLIQFGGSVFRTTTLSITSLLCCMAFGFGIIIVDGVKKAFFAANK